jgi:site-specific recombinase XerD
MTMAKVKKKSCGGLPPDRYLSIEQIQQLRKHLDQAKARGGCRAAVSGMIIDLLLNSGLRAAELSALQMRDLPHCHGKLIVDVREGKGCVRRFVQISSVLAKRIERFVRRYRKGAKPRSPLFVSEQGSKLSYHCLHSRIRIVGRAAGIGRLTPHMLRHTYGTHWYGETKDLFGLQDQLGHADPRTTHIYAKTSNEQMRRQVENFDL